MSNKKREKLSPPTHLEPEYLYNKYKPLRKAVFAKFKDKMVNRADMEELQDTIDVLFIQLVREYNANLGVDFPFFIKKMLDLRTYHYVTNYLKNVNRETYANTEEDEIIIEDHSTEELFQRIIDLHSIDPTIELGEKHRELLIGVLIHRKTLKQLAEEEGVPLDRLHARQYFLRKKFKKIYEDHKREYGEDMY